MVHIYYHIYATKGVEEIIDEQISLIETHFDFPYKLNVGIAIGDDNYSIQHLFEKFNNIRDVRSHASEWTTLDLIQKDADKFGDSDYILYLHTKGASKIDTATHIYPNIVTWRHLMNYFNIEKAKDVFKLFENTEFNTYGALLRGFYMGNFWWGKASFLKTIKIIDSTSPECYQNVDKNNRYNAEGNFLKIGENWKPYSVYNIDSTNPYAFNFKREEYAK
jgi:hypothetical protein